MPGLGCGPSSRTANEIDARADEAGPEEGKEERVRRGRWCSEWLVVVGRLGADGIERSGKSDDEDDETDPEKSGTEHVPSECHGYTARP